jgi:hypothetical protein
MGDKTIFQNSSTLEHIWNMESPPNQKSNIQYTTNSERAPLTTPTSMPSQTNEQRRTVQSTEALTHAVVHVKVQTKHSTLQTQLSGTLACFVR